MSQTKLNARMDPKALLILSAVFMLLNGGVLGLMHKGLPESAQPAAREWRIATLLMAGGGVLLAVQDLAEPWKTLPAANGLVIAASFLYWSAMRRFFNAPPPSVAARLPIALSILIVAWFSTVQPSYAGRVIGSSPILIFYLFAAAWTVHVHRRRGDETSLRVLTGIFAIVGVFLAFRVVYHLVADNAGQTLLSAGSVLNAATSMLVAVLPVIGTTAFLALVSERARRMAEHAAATDELTGLANRRTIVEQARRRMQHARANGAPWSVAVALVDVDHFKQVNDQHGHDVGDLALQHVADLLRNACRASDLPGRHGGEEFAVLLAVNDRDEAREAAERIRLSLANSPLMVGEVRLSITASFGVAGMEAGDADVDALLKRADQALYRAKANGRNRVET
jgi:diguanylate cyclase (GGDEF)-like protein